jgi:hypothetical protein
LGEFDLTHSGSEEEDVHGRPSSKKVRMRLDRNDAEEDTDIAGHDSEGADDAKQVLSGSGEKNDNQKGAERNPRTTKKRS